ncbi:MAG: acylphosphatase [Reichenbachiella sp.]|uniref:acylphosphatase n=1 Tax=Reichenbachiella sp. TaxID=2184521 RepID=UPI003298C2C6
MSSLIGRSILVSGKVQGVFYRASTLEEANKLGLKGWVKNLPAGEVFIEVFGESGAVEKLIAWCKGGPPMSKVSNVSIKEIAFREERIFEITY